MGALRTSMATCGYQDLAEFNRAELMIAPALQTEGKLLQAAQGSAWAARPRRSRGRPPMARSGAHAGGRRANWASMRPSTGSSPGHGRHRARRRVRRGRRPARGRRGRRPRLRRPVLAADRAPRARVRRVLRAAAAPRRGRGGRRRRPKGLILSGGPASVYADGAPRLDPELLELGIPVLGICYGMQLIALELGGRVEGAEVGEFGRSSSRSASQGRLLAGPPDEQTCWMSHRDTVFEAAAGFTRWRRRRVAGGGARGRTSARLRHPVPPRGRPHAVRAGHPQDVPARRLRLRHELVGRVDRRGADRAHPRPGGRRARSSAASAAAWTPGWRRCSSTARSATS